VRGTAWAAIEEVTELSTLIGEDSAKGNGIEMREGTETGQRSKKSCLKIGKRSKLFWIARENGTDKGERMKVQIGMLREW